MLGKSGSRSDRHTVARVEQGEESADETADDPVVTTIRPVRHRPVVSANDDDAFLMTRVRAHPV